MEDPADHQAERTEKAEKYRDVYDKQPKLPKKDAVIKLMVRKFRKCLIKQFDSQMQSKYKHTWSANNWKRRI
jgi:hypothetical protein